MLMIIYWVEKATADIERKANYAVSLSHLFMDGNLVAVYILQMQ